MAKKENNQINKITTSLYCVEFSVEPNPYYPDGKYILLSNIDDSKIHDEMIKVFTLNTGMTTFSYGFIIPKTTYDNVLKPLFDDITQHNKQLTEIMGVE